MLKPGNAMVAHDVTPADPETKRVRVVRLRVIGGRIELRDDVPQGRPQCPTTRPCPHVKCEWHLWMIDGRDRPGRRHPGRRLPSSELRPVWLEWPLPPSCGYDLLESSEIHGWTREQKARALGLSVDSYQWALRSVARKLRELAANGNLALSDFLVA
jgi:hypothetical protein